MYIYRYIHVCIHNVKLCEERGSLEKITQSSAAEQTSHIVQYRLIYIYTHI